MTDRRYSAHRSCENFAVASLVIGIIAVVLGIFTGIGGVGLGSLGMILALMSRGEGGMLSQARLGLGASIAGLVLGILVLAGSIALISSDAFQQQFQQELERYGEEYHFYEEFPSEGEAFPDDGYYDEFLNGI